MHHSVTLYVYFIRFEMLGEYIMGGNYPYGEMYPPQGGSYQDQLAWQQVEEARKTFGQEHVAAQMAQTRNAIEAQQRAAELQGEAAHLRGIQQRQMYGSPATYDIFQATSSTPVAKPPLKDYSPEEMKEWTDLANRIQAEHDAAEQAKWERDTPIREAAEKKRQREEANRKYYEEQARQEREEEAHQRRVNKNLLTASYILFSFATFYVFCLACTHGGGYWIFDLILLIGTVVSGVTRSNCR